MLITFISMGYVYISKICFDFLKRIIPHTLLASPKLLLLGIVKVNFFSALAYSQLYLFSIYKTLGGP